MSRAHFRVIGEFGRPKEGPAHVYIDRKTLLVTIRPYRSHETHTLSFRALLQFGIERSIMAAVAAARNGKGRNGRARRRAR